VTGYNKGRKTLHVTSQIF